MGTVTATLQVNFSDAAASADGQLKLEIDGRDDGLNGGDTSFRPGDNVFYLMYLAGVTLQQHFATAGNISVVGSGARVVAGDDAQYLTFSSAKEASLSYPAGGLSSYEWLGSVFDKDGNSISAPALSLVDNGTKVRVDQKVTGILKVEYNAAYQAYRLSGVPTAIDRAIIFAQATT